MIGSNDIRANGQQSQEDNGAATSDRQFIAAQTPPGMLPETGRLALSLWWTQRRRLCRSAAKSSCSGIADARVQHAVEQINEQIHQG